MKNPSGSDPARMPGMPAEPMPGMKDYLVVLTEMPDVEPNRLRSSYVSTIRDHVAGLQDKLRKLIDEKVLIEEVDFVGEPTSFGMFAIRCTPHVAALIRTIEGVEEVVSELPRFSHPGFLPLGER